MKKEIKNKDVVALLEERAEITEKGKTYFDNIEKIVTEILTEAMPKIATDAEAWKYLRPYIDEAVYKETNGKLEEEYRQIQKLEYKMGRIKEKVMKLVDKEKIKLKEFEEIGSVSIKNGKPVMEIIDLVESYKEMLREKKKK